MGLILILLNICFLCIYILYSPLLYSRILFCWQDALVEFFIGIFLDRVLDRE